MKNVRPMVRTLFCGVFMFCAVPAGTARAGAVITDELTVFDRTTLSGLVSVEASTNTSANAEVLRYTFSTDTTPVPDESGNGNSGTVTGATWVTEGQIGAAYSFDGANDNISAADSGTLDIRGALSIGVWIKASNPGGTKGIVMKYKDPDQYAYGLYMNGGGLICQLSSGGNAGSIYEFKTTSTSVMTTNWMHIAVTWDGTANANGRIYVNGASQAITIQSPGFSGSQIFDSSQPVTIGSKSDGAWYFGGIIDEVHLYSGELSASEVLQLYTTGSITSAVPVDALSVAVPATFSSETTIRRLVKQGDVEMGVYINGP